MKKINLNDTVKVKLTPFGADIFYHQFDEANERIALCGGKEIAPRMPKIDKDGYTDFQLWQFIELYGDYVGIEKKNVISDINIYVPDETLREVNTD